MELDTEPQEQKNPTVGEVPKRDIFVGDIVQHFKREKYPKIRQKYRFEKIKL